MPQAQADASTERPIAARTARPLMLAAWFALLCAAFLALLPLRYTATTRISFEVATQPSAALVRGVVQVLQSREMALHVLDGLPPGDVARLAEGRMPLSAPGWFPGESLGQRDRALATLQDGLNVTSVLGGRMLVIAFSSSRPALSAEVAQSYARSFAALDASVRDEAAPNTALAIPPTRLGLAAEVPAFPDLPRPLTLLALAAAAIALFLAGQRQLRIPRDGARPHGAPLPRQAANVERISWLNAGSETGLSCEAAVERLAQRLATGARQPASAGRLVVFTSEGPRAESAFCAIGLARRLAQEDTRVALVALDGESGDLCALISDPWAPGMTEMLFGVAGFGETIHRDPKSRAHVIPPGRHARGGASVVGADRLTLILKALRQTYDHVVVAAPALPGTAGADRIAALGPLLVCIEEAGSTALPGVETYDALAAHGFGEVIMLALADPSAAPSAEEAGQAPATSNVQALYPSLTANAA
ncbi:MAG: hypothetical protein B7Z15_02770 [Rhizobiales bacterium 32-66-8]|nr:MAG: hypothetical protein B7Z15_02770 [Rhizobiales bacterium 32-66-8]